VAKSFPKEHSIKVLTFFLNQDLYSAPVSDISEVNRMAGIRIVPKAPEYVMGLINLHGTIAPVLNLKSLLQIEPSKLAHNSKWIAARHKNTLVCFAVDKLDRIR
jgi:purine-binding chemotaxis protein CheW